MYATICPFSWAPGEQALDFGDDCSDALLLHDNALDQLLGRRVLQSSSLDVVDMHGISIRSSLRGRVPLSESIADIRPLSIGSSSSQPRSCEPRGAILDAWRGE
jgi:hypothetical protein